MKGDCTMSTLSLSMKYESSNPTLSSSSLSSPSMSRVDVFCRFSRIIEDWSIKYLAQSRQCSLRPTFTKSNFE